MSRKIKYTTHKNYIPIILENDTTFIEHFEGFTYLEPFEGRFKYIEYVFYFRGVRNGFRILKGMKKIS